MNVEEALKVLEAAAQSPRAHAALKTLRAELEGTSSRTQGPPTPGQRSAGRAGNAGGFPFAKKQAIGAPGA
jgi:hypothetical protein